jgi:iron-sulfur cluster assembly accessory protein
MKAQMKQAPADITIDDSAIARVNWIRQTEKLSDDTMLRIAIVGGGCSGFKYAMGLTDEVMPDDLVFADSVVIDTTSLGMLQGSTIAFKDHLTGAQFVIDNPNVQSGCGCGSSFTVKESAGQ